LLLEVSHARKDEKEREVVHGSKMERMRKRWGPFGLIFYKISYTNQSRPCIYTWSSMIHHDTLF